MSRAVTQDSPEDTGAVPVVAVVAAINLIVDLVEKFTAAVVPERIQKQISDGVWTIAKAIDEHVDQAVDLDGNPIGNAVAQGIEVARSFI